jgi:exosortase K
MNFFKDHKQNLPYYLIAIGLFVLLKVGYAYADTDDLQFFLKPIDVLVGLLTGSQSVYLAESGYYHESLHIVIGKTCSGVNFWCLCFLVFSYLGLKYFDRPLHKTLVLPIALLCTYLLTIFANTSRIFASIIMRNQTLNIFPDKQYLLHETVGIVIKLSFLILAYYVIEKFLKHRCYEKRT